MTKRRIVVLGDVMLDQVTRVKVRGVSPENTAVVVARHDSVGYSLGGAANVARCVKALGEDPILYGFNSDRRVEHLTYAEKIVHHFVRPAHGHTPIKNRVVTRDGHYLLRLDDEAEFFGQPDEWWAAGGDYVGGGIKTLLFEREVKPVLCLVDYDKGCLTRAAAKCIMYHVNSVHESWRFPVIVDPGRNEGWEKYGSDRTIFRANLHQAMQLFVRSMAAPGAVPPYPADFDPAARHDEKTYLDIAQRVALTLKAAGIAYAYLVLTLGPGGLVLIRRDHGLTMYKPTAAVAVADACGAGDAVTAAMAVILAGEENPLDWHAVTAAVQTAERAASIAVRMPGVYAVTKEDMGWCTTTPTSPTPRPT